MRTYRTLGMIAVVLLFSLSMTGSLFAADKTIIDDWASVKTPPPPALASVVSVDPAKTALLMLDFNKQACDPVRRPRCIISLPAVKKLLNAARANKLLVVYSLSAGATAADINPLVAALPGEPMVTSGPDKFLGTDLDKILKDKGITTVIVTGTAAHGAVLYTASGAALRSMDTIVPVDGMSAEDLYIEQYVAWHLRNAPRVSGKTILTKIGDITFGK